MKGFKSTSIFAVLVFLFLGYVYFFEYEKSNKEEAQKKESSRLFKSKSDTVTEIKLKWAEGVTLLTKENQWVLKEPVSDLADIAAVNTLLKGVDDEVSESVVAEGEGINLNTYGLADPLGYVELKTQNGSEKIVFGTVDAIGGKKYVLNAEGKVVLVPAFTQTRFVKTKVDLRNKRIIKATKSEIKSIAIKNLEKSETFVLVKENEAWAFMGQTWKVDATEINQFLMNLEALTADEVVSEQKSSPESMKRHHTKTVKQAIEIEKNDGTKESLLFHGTDGNSAFVTDSSRDQVFKVGITQIEPIRVSQDKFRDRKMPFQFSKESVQNVELNTSLLKLKLRKNGQEWTAENLSEHKKVDSSQVSKLIDDVHKLVATGFPKEITKLNRKEGGLKFSNDKNETIFEINWGSDFGQKEKLVTTNLSSELLTVDKTVLAALPVQTILQEKTSTTEKAEVKNK